MVWIRLLSCALLTAAVGCSGGDSSGPPPPAPPPAPIATVTVTPDHATLTPTATVQLTATAKDASGNVLSGRPITWGTSDQTIASVSNAGLVTAAAKGTATITATSEGKNGAATIQVKEGGTVGAGGGTVGSADGTVSLTVPAGALSGDVVITFEPTQGLPAEPRLVGATAFDIGPTGTNFTQPATLKIKYALDQIPAGSQPDSLALFTFSAGAWTAVPGSSVDLGTQTVQAPLQHLSTYGDLAAVRVTRLDVVSRRFRQAETTFDVCTGQRTGVAITLFDGADGPRTGRIITGVSADPATATIHQYAARPDFFYLGGVAAGTTTLTFSSEAAHTTVTAAVSDCPKPAILTTSDRDGQFELYRYINGTFFRLTNNPAGDGEGQVSPNGQPIGFQSDRTGTTQLYLMSLAGTNVQPLVTLAGPQRELQWSGDGSFIVFSGQIPGAPKGASAIFKVNPNGTGLTQLTTVPGGRFPTVSPDNQHIAFSQLGASGHYALMVMNPDGTGLQPITPPVAGQDDITPVFSPLKPGNPEIVFSRVTVPTQAALYRVRLDGTFLVQLTANGGVDFFPAFCADGEHLLYTASSTPVNLTLAGPFELRVISIFIPPSEGSPFVQPDLTVHYGAANYYPRASNPALLYGCKP